MQIDLAQPIIEQIEIMNLEGDLRSHQIFEYVSINLLQRLYGIDPQSAIFECAQHTIQSIAHKNREQGYFEDVIGTEDRIPSFLDNTIRLHEQILSSDTITITTMRGKACGLCAKGNHCLEGADDLEYLQFFCNLIKIQEQEIQSFKLNIEGIPNTYHTLTLTSDKFAFLIAQLSEEYLGDLRWSYKSNNTNREINRQLPITFDEYLNNIRGDLPTRIKLWLDMKCCKALRKKDIPMRRNFPF